MPFHYFNDEALTDIDGSDLFAVHLYAAEAGELLEEIKNRVKNRVMSVTRVNGRDTRTGRDYFFDNIEMRRRNAPGNPLFIGFYHYRKPEERKGSRFEAWLNDHDDEPMFEKSMAEIVAEAQAAFKAGRSSHWLDALVEEVTDSLGF